LEALILQVVCALSDLDDAMVLFLAFVGSLLGYVSVFIFSTQVAVYTGRDLNSIAKKENISEVKNRWN